MKDLEISVELKTDIENNQNELKNAIRNHQEFLFKLREDPDNVDLQKALNKAEEDIIAIGLAQKALLERLRVEYKVHQKNLKANIVKNGIEDRRFNLSNALNRARKQNIVPRTASFPSLSDDSNDSVTAQLICDSVTNPVNPHDLSQSEFLGYFYLATHEIYREMQNKRVERKRRSTANPHFLYGSKGWDFLPKRKRNAYLVSSFSPPNTRQAVRKRAEHVSSPLGTNGSSDYTFPSIPNLPSGLTIERVSPSSSPESKTCISCRQSGNLINCEVCLNSFHVTCHNRPLTQQPKQCPKCITKEVKTVGSLNVPAGMSVSCITSAEVSEKLEEKHKLLKHNQNLTAELTQLQDRHSQLTISLKNQKNKLDELRADEEKTQNKIKSIITFIDNVKKPFGS